MKVCGNCNKEIVDRATKCYYCGKPVCFHCGNILAPGVEKCPRCGGASLLGSVGMIGKYLFTLGFLIIVVVIVLVIF